MTIILVAGDALNTFPGPTDQAVQAFRAGACSYVTRLLEPSNATLLIPEVSHQTKAQITARPLVLEGVKGPKGPFRTYELLNLS